MLVDYKYAYRVDVCISLIDDLKEELILIKFAKPYFPNEWREKILHQIESSLDSGNLTNAINVRNVEDFFTSTLSMNHAVATNSCTAALHLAMILSHIEKGDEVIVPPITFASTANAVLYCNGKPIFVETNPKTLNIDVNKIEEAISDRTKALVVVHLGGVPCDMKRIKNIARDNDLILVEDCAHALGSRYHGELCGTFGKHACFSFYPTKVVAGAEGGILVTNDLVNESRARCLLNQGRSGIGPQDITELGYNYRMNELQAILIQVQLDYLSRTIAYRAKLVERYHNNLSDTEGIQLLEIPKDTEPAFYSLSILVNGIDRNSIRSDLFQEGIETSILYHPVHLQSNYRKLFGYKPGDFPLTEELSSRIISLPLHPHLDSKSIDFICDKLISIINAHST